MNRSRLDLVWNLLSLSVAEILNPLLLISTALFVSVGYILTLLMPVNIDIWVALLLTSVLLPAALLAARARRLWHQREAESERFSWRCFLPFIPLVVFLPPAVAILSLPSTNAIAHIGLYFPHITQLYHGLTPLDHVMVPGYPANHYWLLYALVAAVIKVSTLDIYTTFNLVNLVFLFSSLFWLAQALIALQLVRARTIMLGLLVLFLFCSLNLAGFFSVLLHALNGVFEPADKGLLLLPGADRRLHSIMPKVFHASGMTPGVAAFTASLYILVKTTRGELGLHLLILLSAAGIASIAVMPIVALFIALSLVGGFALMAFFEWATERKRLKSIVASFTLDDAGISSGRLAAWLCVSLLLAIPLIGYVDEFTGNYHSSIELRLVEPVNIRMVLASALLLLPPAGLQILIRLRNGGRQERFLGFSVILGLILSLSIILPDSNQYKFHYLLSMLLALLSLCLLRNAREWRGAARRRAIEFLMNALVLLAIMNSMLGSYAVIARAIQFYGTTRFIGLHLVSDDDMGGRLPAIEWIRANSPPTAIVVIPHAYIGRAALLHERLNYVSQGAYFYVDGIPEHDQRLDELHKFFDPSTPIEIYAEILDRMKRQLPGRPLYAVVMDPELNRETMAQRGARLVFENPPYGAHAYLLNPSAAS